MKLKHVGAKDVFDPDRYFDEREVPGGYYRTVVDALYKNARDDDSGAHIIMLCSYDSWKEPDTPYGPGEWEVEYDILGHITDQHLESIKAQILSDLSTKELIDDQT